MTITQQVSDETYERVALAEPDRQWELYDGQLRERPGMSWEHGRVVARLSFLLLQQLDLRQFQIGINEWRVRRPPGTIFIPDIVVVPMAYGHEFEGRPGQLAIFREPLPLVIEVWSSSPGDYDIDTKIPEYQQRGDLEIWRINPYEKTLTA